MFTLGGQGHKCGSRCVEQNFHAETVPLGHRGALKKCGGSGSQMWELTYSSLLWRCRGGWGSTECSTNGHPVQFLCPVEDRAGHLESLLTLPWVVWSGLGSED
jgi:hypothetical protein